MVKLHVKRRDESQFLYETTTDTRLSQLVPHVVSLYNGRLKVDRLCQGAYAISMGRSQCALIRITIVSAPPEIELLAQHGTMLPPDMIGLTEEQV